LSTSIAGFLRSNWMGLLFLAAIVLVYVVFHSSGTPLESTVDFDATVNAGQPVIVEFFSNT